MSGQLQKFDPASQPPTPPATHAMVTTREAQEVQAAMIVAQRFPRDMSVVMADLDQMCRRQSLAMDSMYTYSRGGTRIEGASIRLAEAIGQAMGHIRYGTVELERSEGESVMLAFAWDLQRNVFSSKVFNVRHWRDTKQGGHALSDERDIYEITANYGARRVRACILAIIPSYVEDEAVDRCKKTCAGDSTVPLAQRTEKMVTAFAAFGVTPQMIEKRLGHKLAATSEHELVSLRGVYTSLKDGFGGIDSYFDLGEPESPDAPDAGTATIGELMPGAAPAPTPLIPTEELIPRAAPGPTPPTPTDDRKDDVLATPQDLALLDAVIKLSLTKHGRRATEGQLQKVCNRLWEQHDIPFGAALSLGDVRALREYAKVLTHDEIMAILD